MTEQSNPFDIIIPIFIVVVLIGLAVGQYLEWKSKDKAYKEANPDPLKRSKSHKRWWVGRNMPTGEI